MWMSKERKELSRWNKKHFSELFNGYHLVKRWKTADKSGYSGDKAIIKYLVIIFICWEIFTYPTWVSPPNLELFSKKVHVKEAALDNCRLFMDGTVRPVCKPINNQKATSNGDKRIHAIKFQSVIAPNELYCKFVWSSWRKKS